MSRTLAVIFGLSALTFAVLPLTSASAGMGGGGITIPAGDSLAFTPPIDWTPQQIAAAPPQYRARALQLQRQWLQRRDPTGLQPY